MMSPAAPAIRPAAAADAPALGALSQAAFIATFVEGFGLPYAPDDLAAFLAQSHGPAAFARMLADPAQRVWIAEAASGEALAYASAGPCTLPHPEAGPPDPELKRLYLRADAQGAGLAARMMDVVLAAIDPEGEARVWLGVWSGNLRAQRFYARYGFETVGEYGFPVGATIDREFIMRRGSPGSTAPRTRAAAAPAPPSPPPSRPRS